MPRASVIRHLLEVPEVVAVGTVAVFEDLYGNLWDLLEWSPQRSPSTGAG